MRPSQSVNDFYDAVAVEYDSHMTESDVKVREAVKECFIRNVPMGPVLDFGGGTGIDTRWLLNSGLFVYLLEPSNNMRAVAKANNPPTDKLVFIEKNTNFNEWSTTHLPFDTKVNGVLANFAVLNSIEKLDLFFEKVSLIAAVNCTIVATVIDGRPNKVIKTHSPLLGIKLLFKTKVTIQNRFNGLFHETYIHSRRSFIQSSKPLFSLESYMPLEFSSFSLLVFKKI